MIYRTDEDALTREIVALASEYGRYGYRRITALLRDRGWHVGKDRVQRIWRREGLKVPQKQRPRGRLWLGDGSCLRLRPERANHVWSYDFVRAMTHDGRTLRMLTLIDKYTRECLAIRVARRLGRYEVIEALADVMLYRARACAHLAASQGRAGNSSRQGAPPWTPSGHRRCPQDSRAPATGAILAAHREATRGWSGNSLPSA